MPRSTRSAPPRWARWGEALLPALVGVVALAGSLLAAEYRQSLTEPVTLLLAVLVSALVAGLTWVLAQGKLRAMALADSTARTLRDSEERFRSLAASSPVGIFQTDVDGVLQYANRRFTQVAGLDEREPLCGDWLCIAHPEDRGAVAAAWHQAVADGAELSSRFRVPTTDGGIRWVHVQAAPLRDDAGALVGYVGSVQNTTDQVQAYELRQRLAAIVESSDDAILATGLDGTIESWNPGAERLYGWSAEEAMGRPVSILAPPDGTDAVAAAMERVLLRRQSERYDAVVVTRDGRRLEVSLTTSPTKDPDGKVIGTSTIARDVTERKRAERDLAVTAAALQAHTVELERSNAELAQFAYVASHDLSEPLRMVSSYVQLLAKRYRGKLDDDADEFIAFAVDGADRMQALINALLAYSRVGRAGLERRPVDCDEVLRRVLRNLGATLRERGAEVTVGPLPTVQGDPTQLEQLFQNLIGNSAKFTAPGQPPRIVVEGGPEGDGWRFAVTDNGIGIEPRHAERIFSMFQRLHGRQEYPGTGIGLAICRKIVELHGGRIWVEQAEGWRQPVHVHDRPVRPGRATVRPGAHRRRPARGGPGRTTGSAVSFGHEPRIFDVLLVEDNPGDVRLVKEVLTEADEPVELHVAADGESAMAWLRDPVPGRPPDLLLLDLNLPRKGGLEVLEELKADPALRRIPVVVLTSSAADRDVRGAYDRHANCFVTKPLGLEDFVSTVRDIAGFWLRAAELPRA